MNAPPAVNHKTVDAHAPARYKAPMKTHGQVKNEAEAVKKHIAEAQHLIMDSGTFSDDQMAALSEAFDEIGKALIMVI